MKLSFQAFTYTVAEVLVRESYAERMKPVITREQEIVWDYCHFNLNVTALYTRFVLRMKDFHE